MARWLLDCEPLCGHPWRLGLATESEEREASFRLRYDVFFREQGYGPEQHPTPGRDTDPFDDWCEHLILYDTSCDEVIGTYRAIFGSEAIRRDGFYGHAEFDLSPLDPIAPKILQGSRTCVSAKHRNGLAIQYLTYGMELLLRQSGCQYFLGSDSFRTDTIDTLNSIYSYVLQNVMDPEYRVQPLPANRLPELRVVPVTAETERLLPTVIRMDFRMGFRACGEPAWDPEFRCYDLLVLGRRERFTKLYTSFVERIEKKIAR